MKITDTTRTAAIARTIVRRSARLAGLPELPEGTQATRDDLQNAARSCPLEIAGRLRAAFEHAAAEWTRGNNSKSDKAMQEAQANADRQHDAAALVLDLFGLTAELPGLYPVFINPKTGARNHWPDIEHALREATA